MREEAQRAAALTLALLLLINRLRLSLCVRLVHGQTRNSEQERQKHDRCVERVLLGCLRVSDDCFPWVQRAGIVNRVAVLVLPPASAHKHTGTRRAPPSSPTPLPKLSPESTATGVTARRGGAWPHAADLHRRAKRLRVCAFRPLPRLHGALGRGALAVLNRLPLLARLTVRLPLVHVAATREMRQSAVQGM